MKLFELRRRRSASAMPALREQRNMLCDRLSFTAAESYKQLRTNLMFALPNDKKCRIVGVTSSIRNEGKSTTAINLAYTLAETGKKVLLIDADMRLPSVAKKLGTADKPGLSNLLAGMCEGGDAIYDSAFFPNWSIMPAGDIPPNPSELLGSEQMEKLLAAMSEGCDFIVVDLPPVDIVSDALAVGHWIDGVIVVVRANYTDRRALKECMRQLSVLESKVLGFVMTGVEEHQKTYGKYGKKYYGKDYAYGYGRTDEPRQRGSERTARDGDRRIRSERSVAARTGSQAGSRAARRSEDKQS